MAIWSGPSFPSESLCKKTPMFTFDSESTNPFYRNQLQRRQQCLSTFLISEPPTVSTTVHPLVNSATQPDGNTKSGESSEKVSTSLGISNPVDQHARHQPRTNGNSTLSAGNTKSGECREEVPTSPGIPRHLDIPHLRRLCFARYYVACMREYNILLKQGQTIALRLSDHR